MRSMFALGLAAAAFAAAAGRAAVDQDGSGSVLPADLLRHMALEPGLWRTTIRVEDAELSAAESAGEVPPSALAALRQQVGKARATEDCLGTGSRPTEI